MRSVFSTLDEWARHRTARLGAALAYYSVFSLGPLLQIVTSGADLFGEEAVRGPLTAQFRGMLGETGSQAVEGEARPQAATSRPRSALSCSSPPLLVWSSSLRTR